MKINLPPVKKPRIEMLPLMDIVFLLLVVFIYSMLSMSVHHGMPVTLPVSSVTKPEKSFILSVTIKSNDLIYVDHKITALENLANVLKQKSKDQENPGVLLFAEKSIPYQRLFQVLDQIKIAGLSKISLQAEPEAHLPEQLSKQSSKVKS
ncbi:MAG: biopolymer transporter ExbD [Desulfobacteraceae bacterium]|nr:biopolymer transporter ExbD [Desulfobacteraceae bacterium]